MRPLRKIDNYLLENHPLLWMSKIHYVLPISLLVNALFWLWGNLAVDYRTLRNRVDEELFFESYAIYGYMLAVLMFIILWATSYFKKNASRHLYPLKKFYFPKLLVLLFVIFYLIGAPFLSFFSGVNAKVQSLASYTELQQEIKMVNLAQTFLPRHSDGSYKYSEYLSAKDPAYDILRSEEWSAYDFNKGSYNPYDHPENNDTISDGTIIQYLKVTTAPNTCYDYEEDYFDGYRKVPEEVLLDVNNVNYRVSEFIDEQEFNAKPKGWFDYYWYYDEETNYALTYNNEIRKISGNKQKITEVLEQFSKFLDKHQIRHAFNAPVIAEFLVKNGGEFNYPYVDENMLSNDSYSYYYDPAGYEQELQNTEDRYKLSSAKTTVEDLESDKLHFDIFLLDNYSLKSMFQNSKRTYYWKTFYIESLVIGFFALGLAFLFLLFSFADFITLVITIPVIGVLIIINSLICGIIYSALRNDDYLFLEPLIFAIGVLITYGVLLRSKNVSRRLVHAVGYISGFISTMLLIGIVAAIAILTRERVYECDYWTYAPSTWMRWLEDPGFSFTLGFVGILLYSLTIKKLIAKPD